MLHVIWFIIGVVVGFMAGGLVFFVKAAYGYFKIEPVPDEEDLYTVNMRLLPDQNLKKRHRIILTRE